MYNAFNFADLGQNAVIHATNTTAVYTKLGYLLCPSDIDRLTTASGHNNYGMNAGSTPYSLRHNYLPNSGSTAGISAFLHDGKGFSPVGMRDVTDGTSNTAAFSERVKGIGDWNNGTFDSTRPTSSVSTIAWPPGVSAADYAICLATRPTPTTMVGGLQAAGSNWAKGFAESNTLYNHVMPPNTWSCVQATTSTNFDWGVIHTASSRHPGVVNVLFCDGTVKAIKSSINLNTWWAVGTKSGGEIIDIGPVLSGSRRRATRARRCREGREGFDRAPRTPPVGRRPAPGRDDRRCGATRSRR